MNERGTQAIEHVAAALQETGRWIGQVPPGPVPWREIDSLTQAVKHLHEAYTALRYAAQRAAKPTDERKEEDV